MKVQFTISSVGLLFDIERNNLEGDDNY
jgi:hypothetical protein